MEKIKMLVVDDIPQTRKDIIRLLYFEDDMLVIGEAGDGMEALKKIGELQPDVVLMDINMPQMDGITATERVCQLHPHIAIIIISIQGELEYLRKAMVAGARDYLVKPLGSEEMATTIRSVYKQQCMRFPKDSQVHGVVETQRTSRNGCSSEAQVRQNSYERHAQELFHEPQQQLGRRTETSTQPLYRHDQLAGNNDAIRQPSYKHEQLLPVGNGVMGRTEDMRQPSYGHGPLPGRHENMQQSTYGHENIRRRTEDMRQPSFNVEQYATNLQQRQAMFQSHQVETGQNADLPYQPVQQSRFLGPELVSQPVDNKLPTEPQVSQSHLPVEMETVVKEGSQGDDKPLGEVIAVFCGKGGVGKTMIATNLAVTLAQQEKKKVALVDYDLQFGDISVLLNLSDGKNLGDLVQQVGELSKDVLNNYMIRHFSGIDILPAPLFPQDAEYVTAEHGEKILNILKKSYDYVIVDTAPTFNDISLQVLDLANRILLITTRDIVTIKNTKTSLNILETLNYREKVRVVLNRSDQDLGVEVSDLEKGLDITVSYQIASDEKAAISAINKGVPLVISHANSEFTRSMKRLVDRMVVNRRHTKADKQSKGIITRMFSL